ncbi:hypothetical protein HTG_00490 [Natrinema mahii]|nr:hypothetical protein HTG_00490 [Natrinema mahii]
MAPKRDASTTVRSEEVASMYNELTGTYRRMWDTYDHQSIHSGYFDDDHDDIGAAAKNMTRIVADAADIDAETRVLDIGCGAGGDPV